MLDLGSGLRLGMVALVTDVSWDVGLGMVALVHRCVLGWRLRLGIDGLGHRCVLGCGSCCCQIARLLYTPPLAVSAPTAIPILAWDFMALGFDGLGI